jgi:amino acid transporter
VFLIYYEVSGGPFGVEDSVKAGGPLLALLGFIVFPVIWSIPEALVTAEMGTMFPENGGYVVWVSSAFGPFWGFQQGWMKWLSGVIDNALYPVLFLDYLKSAIPALGGGLPRVIAVLVLTVALTYMNYRGLTIVGWTAVCLGVFSLLPFCAMGLISIPKLDPARWLVVDMKDINWNLYLNTLFWNLNYWDSVSTLAGEVDNPKKTLPKALFWGMLLVVLGYFVPLLISAAWDGRERNAARGFWHQVSVWYPSVGYFVFSFWCAFAVMDELPRNHSRRKLSILFWHVFGICSFYMVKNQESNNAPAL